MRQRVNVLTSGLHYWMEQTQLFTNAQQSALEATSMNKLLERRDSGLAWMSSLKEEDVQDPMLKAALQSLPHEKVPSKRELIKDLHRLRTSLEYHALLPPSGGGLLSQLTASIGAKLKFKAIQTSDPDQNQQCACRFQRFTATQPTLHPDLIRWKEHLQMAQLLMLFLS